MQVMKFGGTSVADRAAMQRVARIVQRHNGPLVVVLSAMGQTTDRLLELGQLAEAADVVRQTEALAQVERAHLAAVEDEAAQLTIAALFDELRSVLQGIRLLREQTPRSRALLTSFGERLAAPILAAHIEATGRAARAMDARAFVVTDDNHERAQVRRELTRGATHKALDPLLKRGVVPVVTGFVGATEAGVTTVLGRGGSDFTAALLANLLEATGITIWTDVDGILTADPRLVAEATTLEQVSYREAAEMSYFGARVLHPKTVSPAVERSIPIRIRNSFRPDEPGTLICATSPALPQGGKTVCSVPDLTMVSVGGTGMAGIPGVARKVFEAAERADANVIMISQASSEQTISLVVPSSSAERLALSLRQAFALELEAGLVSNVSQQREVAVISIVGEAMAGSPGVSGRLFGALGKVQINVLAIAQGASELSISVALDQRDVPRAVRAIHTAFGLTKRVNLMVLGCGRVARTFLQQLEENGRAIEQRLGLDLRLVGMATSRRLLLGASSLPPGTAEAMLPQGDPRPDDEELMQRLLAGSYTDLVLVDLTAADTEQLQLAALRAGVHVVTANKRPLSGPLASYQQLMQATSVAGARLAYETTFGAGLPVLHTLKELRDTGDRFDQISGCFSGTLGFICSRLDDGISLREAVRQAQDLGLTEPDPREDLSGRDVARKALIIARSAGIPIEADAVLLEPLVADLDAGLDGALAQHAAAVEQRAAQARERGAALRYVATITPSRVEVGLREFSGAHPIGALRGQDNMLVYRTSRYDEFPLVIRGPGAGAEVTAAGVLGDVLRVAQS